MSERNGDKSRFGRIRKKNIIQRKRSRELVKPLAPLRKKTIMPM